MFGPKTPALKPMKGSILLRKTEMRDVAHITRWAKSPDMGLYLVGIPDMPDSELEQRIAEEIRRTQELYPAHLFLMIETLDRRPIGAVIYRELDWKHRHVAIEVIIGDEKARGQGYGAESFYAAAEYAFCELNVHRIFCYVYSFNRASLKLMQMGGMHQDAVFRQAVFRNGTFHDSLVFSLLDKEFPRLARRAGMAKKRGY